MGSIEDTASISGWFTLVVWEKSSKCPTSVKMSNPSGSLWISEDVYCLKESSLPLRSGLYDHGWGISNYVPTCGGVIAIAISCQFITSNII